MHLLFVACFVLGTGCATTPTFEAYHRAAARQRARLAKPPAVRAARKPSAELGLWPIRFTGKQLDRLERAGCRFDPADLARARALHRRGYTAAEFVRAYEDVKRYARWDRSQLLALAAYRVAGFDLSRYERFRRSKRGLTGYYNLTFAKSRSVRDAGWFLGVAGLAGVMIGAGFLIGRRVSIRRCENDSDMTECEGDYDGLANIISGSITGLGGLLTLVGGLMVIVTSGNPHWFLARPVLDNADAATLRDFRRWRHLAEGKRTGTSLSMSPVLTRGGGGLVLRLRF